MSGNLIKSVGDVKDPSSERTHVGEKVEMAVAENPVPEARNRNLLAPILPPD